MDGLLHTFYFMGDETEGEYEDLTKPRKVLYKAIYWVNLGKAQDQGIQFWQSRSHTIFFYDSVPAGCIEKVVSTTGDKILYRRIPAPRTPPKVVLKNVWQVQHDRQSSNEQSCAERDLFKIDLSVQEVPQNAVLEDQGRVTKSQDADLKKAGKFNTFSDEAKKTVQQLGKIELFALGEVSTKIQCLSCAKYCPEGLLCCICGKCSRSSKEQTRKTKEEFDALSIPHSHCEKYSRRTKHGRSEEQHHHSKSE